jgi:hypothetical protein
MLEEYIDEPNVYISYAFNTENTPTGYMGWKKIEKDWLKEIGDLSYKFVTIN